MHRFSHVNSIAARPAIRRMGVLFLIAVTVAAALLLLYQTVIAGPGEQSVIITTAEDLQIGGCDDKDETTECSLRDAIVAANTSQRIKSIEIPLITGTTTLSGTTIFTLTLQGTDEDAAKKGDLDIKKDLELTGQGAGKTIIVGVGDRVFEVLPNVSLIISGTTVQDGAADIDGGAIRNRGTLEIANSVIMGSRAGGNGGAIWSGGDSVSVVRSAIISNTAVGSGGAIYVDSGSMSLNNSTISGNNAGASGGGIHNNGPSLNLSYASVVSNSAAVAGGLSNAGSSSYDSTIFAGNEDDGAAGNDGVDCSNASGITISNGYNLFPESTSCSTVVTDTNTSDALLAPLTLVLMEDGGGETYVHELLPGSPAADKIPDGTNGCGTTVTTDQRGKTRPAGTKCEIGAYEALLAQPGPVFENNTISVEYDGVCGFDHCNLREAIEAANNKENDSDGPDEIHFNVPGSDANAEHVILVTAALPPITDPVIISGTTQLTGTIVLQGPLQEPSDAEGACSASSFDGLTITGADSVISGLEIKNFPGDGVAIGNDTLVTNNGGNTVVDNFIHDNGGAGVCVDGVSENPIRGNNISTNTIGSANPIGISLVDFGNQNQQPPTLTVSIVRTADYTPTSDIGGFLQGDANTTYDVEVFSNPIGDPICSNAEGHTFLASTSLTTDESGRGTFLVEDLDPLAVAAGATATATDPAGNTSEFSVCKSVETLNDTWLTAKALTDVLPTAGASASQVVFQTGQPLWFKFPVEQDGKVTLSVNGQPGTIVTLHRNLFDQYEALENADDAAVLAASDLPAGYLPAGYLPAGYLPAGYLPAGYLPAGYLPAGYLPAGYLPAGYLPAGYLPAGYLPAGYLPAGYLPAGYLPAGYLPADVLPAGYLPELYSGAVRRSLTAIANDPAAIEQKIVRNTWDESGELYAFVNAPASLSEETTVTVTFDGGLCEGVGFLDPPAGSNDIVNGGVPALPPSVNTLIVWDSARMAVADPDGDMAALAQKLSDFAGESTVNGVVIDLAENGGSMFPRVIAATMTADLVDDANNINNPSCVSAKNQVATEIKRVVDAYRAKAGASLEYIVLIGSDYVVPYFRYPDEAGLANENDYVPPVGALSASEAALRRGQVLGQDAYGAANELARSGYSVPLPELAVGRLVRTAEQVSAMIDAYVDTGGVVTPGSALATGYDFVADVGEQARIEFTDGLTGTVDALITPQEEGLENAWTGDQLRAELLEKRHDLVFMAGHFTAGSLVAADYQTQLSASEVATGDFANSIILGLGCHGGYNIPEPDSIDLSPDPDWPEIFLAEQATLVASTGYAYGDTELLEYGERLFLNLIKQLRSGEVEEVAIGKALVAAKLDYFTQHPTMEGIDDKTVLETILYGFPMLRVNMPGSRSTANEPSIVSSVAPLSSGPQGATGLRVGQAAAGSQTEQVQPAGALSQSSTIQVTTDLTRHDVVLTDTISNVAKTTTYFEGGDGVVARPAEPIFPLERRNVDADGFILRGVGFYGGQYTDTVNTIPHTSAPTTENSRARPAFFSDVLYPSELSSINYVDTVSDGPTWLNVTGGQYLSENCASFSGTMRTFSSMDFLLYYLEEDWAQLPLTDTVRLAAIAAAPEIISVSSVDEAGQIQFSVTVRSDPAAPVEAAWVTWTDPTKTGADGTNTWQSLDLDLSQDPEETTLWEATLFTADVPTSAVFMVQATSAGGLVSQATNDGAFFTIGAPTPLDPAPTSIRFTDVFTYFGAFGKTVTFEAELTDGEGVVGGQQIILSLGGQRVCANTNSDGAATFNLTLSQSPGEYTVQASFRGNPAAGLAASVTGQEPFEILRDEPKLILESPLDSFTILSFEPNDVAALLTDSEGRPLPEKTISFVASQGGTETVLPVELKTDLDGRVALGVVDTLASGQYELTAYFSGFVEGATQGLFDDVLLYNADSATASLTVNSRPAADAGGPYQVDEGSSIALDGSNSTDEGSIVSYDWDFNYDGSTFDLDALGDLPTFSAANLDGPSSSTVALRVTDNVGASHIDTATVTVNNVVPTATFNALAAVDEGATIGLSLTGAGDPSIADAAAGFEYAFDCGDGSGFGAFGSASSAACSTNDDGTRTVKGKIRDKDGGVSEYSGSVTVDNVIPTASFSAPASVDEGDTISLSLTGASDPSSADTTAGFEYAFDCGDGSGLGAFGSASSTTCSTNDSGVRTVQGKIRDKDGGVSEYGDNVTVNNIAPSATFSAPATVDEGEAINLSLTGASDPSSVDATAGFEYAFDCGDGSGFGAFGSESSASCSTNDNGTRAVGGKIKDKDGGVTEYGDIVTVNNVVPTATFNAPVAVDEGSSFSLSLSDSFEPSGPDIAAGLEYAFDCGGGFGSFGASNNAICPTSDNGTVTVRGRIRDKDGGTTEYSDTVTVNNVSPAAGAIDVADTLVPLGTTLTTSVTFTDPGISDTHTALWAWGDGATLTGTVTETGGSGFATGDHVYNKSGFYTITVTITDDDGGATATILQNVRVGVAGVGKVIGGGRVIIDSDACVSPQEGPLNPYCSTTSDGNANTGFDVQYFDGSEVPVGQMTLSYKGGGLNLSGDVFQIMVIIDDMAVFRGEGMLGAMNEDTVSVFFEVTAIDSDINNPGEPDRFGVKIWYLDSGELVLDTSRITDSDGEPVPFGTVEGIQGASVKIQ